MLAKWCLGKGLLYESRRAVGKALLWDRRNSEAISMTHKKKLNGDLLYAALRMKEKGIWKRGRWVPERVFLKSGKERVEKVRKLNMKHYGLPFEGDFLPNLDILYTVPAEEILKTKKAVKRYLGYVRGRFFLTDPKKPFLFYYLRDAAEFKKVGQDPMMGGSYVWGRGALYVYPGFMGTGTILHELTHAYQEASFEGFPPLWLNEGLASFFETFVDLGEVHPFGIVNWRDAYYAKTVKAGSARSLTKLVNECALAIDPAGYGHGRALMNFLWSRGELEAFLITAQLKEPKKTYRKPKEIGLAFGKILEESTRMSLDEIGKELEAFAPSLAKRGTKLKRGVRADESVDGSMGNGPMPE
jgi:hypothetical protein